MDKAVDPSPKKLKQSPATGRQQQQQQDPQQATLQSLPPEILLQILTISSPSHKGLRLPFTCKHFYNLFFNGNTIQPLVLWIWNHFGSRFLDIPQYTFFVKEVLTAVSKCPDAEKVLIWLLEKEYIVVGYLPVFEQDGENSLISLNEMAELFVKAKRSVRCLEWKRDFFRGEAPFGLDELNKVDEEDDDDYQNATNDEEDDDDEDEDEEDYEEDYDSEEEEDDEQSNTAYEAFLKGETVDEDDDKDYAPSPILLENGVDPNETIQNLDLDAVYDDHTQTDFIQHVLKRRMCTLWEFAIQKGWIDLVKLIMSRQTLSLPRPRQSDSDPLNIAVKHNQVPLAKLFIEEWGPNDEMDILSLVAGYKKNRDMLVLLLDTGAPPYELLEMALFEDLIQNGCVDIIKLIIERAQAYSDQEEERGHMGLAVNYNVFEFMKLMMPAAARCPTPDSLNFLVEFFELKDPTNIYTTSPMGKQYETFVKRAIVIAKKENPTHLPLLEELMPVAAASNKRRR